MRLSFFEFCKRSLADFSEAVINLFIFFPYFFSINSLFKTLFFPWKNLVARKNTSGFSFDEWLSRHLFNTISRLIGFFMRFSIILFFVIFQIIFILSIPFFTLFFILILPFLYLEYLFSKTEEEKKEILKNIFLSQRLLKEENRQKVEQWFESYYQTYKKKKKWWTKSRLFSIPPLARDWASGFTPTLDQYSLDLTSSDYQQPRENIIDRQKEIAGIEQILSQSEKANVIIVGEEGVGKHTIVDAIARKAYQGTINPILAYKRFLKLDMEKILTQYTDQKQREYFFDNLLSEANQAKNCVIVIDNLEKYITSGENSIDLTLPLEKYAKQSTLQIIGITSPFNFQRYIIPNEKINRLFTKFDVYEISAKEAENILLNNVFLYEKKHHVIVPYETILNIIDKSAFFVTHIPFPEKAIHLLDLVCAYANQQKQSVVKPQYVEIVISQLTHIPIFLSDHLKQKLLQLENLLSDKIIQQEEAIKELASAIRRSFILIGKRKKPLASFLFLGPTGVGKTETAKALVEIFFQSSSNSSEFLPTSTYLIRFDMSLYQEKSDIPKLIGSIETGNPGLLTAAIREKPYGVLLLDEIEKADHDLLNIFLTVLDEGYFADGFGKKVDCKNLIIIATSNAKTTDVFPPEFLNRFDGIIFFKPLAPQAIIKIAKKITEKIISDIYKVHKITVNIPDDLLINLAEKSYHPEFGARDMERLIRREIEDKIAKIILEKKINEGEVINL